MYYRKRENESYEVSEKQITEEFIEMDDNLFSQGEDGEFYLKTYLASNEYQEELNRRKVYMKCVECRQYLYDTDYVVIKLSELKLDNDSSEVEKYADVLAKRKECRKYLNDNMIEY